MGLSLYTVHSPHKVRVLTPQGTCAHPTRYMCSPYKVRVLTPQGICAGAMRDAHRVTGSDDRLVRVWVG